MAENVRQVGGERDALPAFQEVHSFDEFKRKVGLRKVVIRENKKSGYLFFETPHGKAVWLGEKLGTAEEFKSSVMAGEVQVGLNAAGHYWAFIRTEAEAILEFDV